MEAGIDSRGDGRMESKLSITIVNFTEWLDPRFSDSVPRSPIRLRNSINFESDRTLSNFRYYKLDSKKEIIAGIHFSDEIPITRLRRPLKFAKGCDSVDYNIPIEY